METKLDCGDNSCEFAETKTGMRTNGGCRCLKDLDTKRRMAARNYVMALRGRVAELERDARMMICLWCGETFDAGVSPQEAAANPAVLAPAYEWATTHDQGCPKNPLRERLDALVTAARRCMEISTGLAASGIVGHHDVLNVLGAALKEQEQA